VQVLESGANGLGGLDTKDPSRYDLDMEDLGKFCPKIDGFLFSLSDPKGVKEKHEPKESAMCYKYSWVPDPCSKPNMP
jgi:hypothetical protein